MTGRIKRGDMLIAINGQSVTHLSFSDVITLLKNESSPFLYLRFLRWAYYEERAEGDIVEQYLQAKPSQRPSCRPPPLRSLYFGVFPCQRKESGPGSESGSGLDKEGVLWVAETYLPDKEREVIGVFESEREAAEVGIRMKGVVGCGMIYSRFGRYDAYLILDLDVL